MSFVTHNGSRFRRTIAAFMVVLLLVPALVYAQAKQIVEIRIAGNERVSTDAIMAVVPLRPGTAYAEPAVQTAKEAISKMGYFSSVVAGIEDTDAGVRVVFSVVENPVVKEIKITGNTVVESQALQSLMRTQIGSVLNTSTLQQDLTAIESYYRERGYIANITESFGIDPQTGVLTIPIQEVTVESIRVVGNRKTKTNVVLREMETKPGNVFNQQVLMRDLRRIYDRNIFEIENAEPYRLEPGAELGKVVVIIPVRERKTGEISVGVGYSSRQKLVGQARLTESNLFGRAQTVNLLWEQSGDRGSSYEVGFFEPWLDSKQTSLGVNLYNKLIFRFSSSLFGSGDTDVSDYNERRKGGSVTLSRPFSRASRGFVTLRTESVDTENLTSQLSSAGNVSSATFRLTNSSRDSEIDPFRGLYTSYAVEFGKTDANNASTVFENDTFSKYSADVRSYFSKGGARKEINERRAVLAVRATGGTISGDVPFFEQYFLGGAETLRGYREDRFWGKNMFLANVEYRVPVAPSLKGVVFVDFGDAWGASNIFRDPNDPNLAEDEVLKNLLADLPQHEDFDASVGYGLGIRVVTPIGPLRLDYGFGSEGSRAHFSIGHVF